MAVLYHGLQNTTNKENSAENTTSLVEMTERITARFIDVIIQVHIFAAYQLNSHRQVQDNIYRQVLDY